MTEAPIIAPMPAKGSNQAPKPALVFNAPVTARIEKITAAYDKIERSVLELYFKDAPDLFAVDPYDEATGKALKSVGIERSKHGWTRDGVKFERGESFTVDWTVKYRRDKMNDYRLLEAADNMAKKTDAIAEPRDLNKDLSEMRVFIANIWQTRGIHDLNRQRTIVTLATGNQDVSFKEQLKNDPPIVLQSKINEYISAKEPTPDPKEDYRDAQKAIDAYFAGSAASAWVDTRTVIQHEVLTEMYGTISLEAAYKQPAFDEGLMLANIQAATEEKIREDANREKHVPLDPVGEVEPVEESDKGILDALKKADAPLDDLTPSPDEKRPNDLDATLQRLPDNSPNPDPKPPVISNEETTGKGKAELNDMPLLRETEAAKTEASNSHPDRIIIDRAMWTKWEEDQVFNLNIDRTEILKALNVEKYSAWTGTLTEANQALLGYCNQRKTLASAKHELEQAGVPTDQIIQWIAEAPQPPKASDPLSVAQWLDPLRSKAMTWNANKPEPVPTGASRAIVPVNGSDKPIPQGQMALTVPALPMRTIKLPTPDELNLMQTFAKAVASSKLYRDIDSVDKALVILWKGFEMGVSFGAALDGIYIIQGRPWPGSMILKAVVDASGMAERFDILNDGSTCRVIVKRKDRTSINEYSYSYQEAKDAGLTGKDAWKNHSKRMIAHRAVRQAVMSEFPDIAAGIGMDFNGDDEE